MTTLTARRLLLTPGELDLLRSRLDLPVPPGFAVEGARGEADRLEKLGVMVDGVVHRSVAAGLVAACAPEVGVLIAGSVGRQEVTAVLGVRGALGGSLAHSGAAAVEVAMWPAERLGSELARVVPALPDSVSPGGSGSLRATVVTDTVVGQVWWLATEDGWVAVEPDRRRDGHRGAAVRAVQPHDLGPSLAPYLATALS